MIYCRDCRFFSPEHLGTGVCQLISNSPHHLAVIDVTGYEWEDAVLRTSGTFGCIAGKEKENEIN